MSQLDGRYSSAQDDHWIPLSDLMTGLMMMFLLVAMIYMVKVEADNKVIKDLNLHTRDIVTKYQLIKSQLYQDLRKEFEKDLPKWNAELLPDSTLRFDSPEVLFDSGKADLKPMFANILMDFFPRYIAILSSSKYRDTIEEIRIEGHTSSYWQSSTSEQDAYFQNMKLSQERTRSALEFVMSLPQVANEIKWLEARVTANGLSSSKLIRKPDGTEDVARSQRVEFRVRTNSDKQIDRIIETLK
jgi:outer membrane protein OmpA-like peptidoglycan-associated protein